MPHILPDQLESHKDYMWYFENIAESNKLIGHLPEDPAGQRFFKTMAAITGTQIKGMIMIVLRVPKTYVGNGGDNVHEFPKFEILIAKAAGDNGEDAIVNALCECEVAANQVLAQINYDSLPDVEKPRYFTHFLFDETIDDVMDEPQEADGWVWISKAVRLGNPRDFTRNPDDWINPEVEP